MLKKISGGLEKWGHYFLALLCALVILLSAIWTRGQQAGEQKGSLALNDQSQTLSDVTPAPALWQRPVSGEVVRPYSETPVYFPQTGVWMIHPALDFSASEGETVLAMADGVVAETVGEVRILLPDGRVCVYRGILEVSVQIGQRVKAGEKLGLSGGQVPFEGAGHLCVMVYDRETPISFGGEWVDKNMK